ncbi:response regulator [Candidatus Competibacter phosphatis]|uniref:Response regulator n=1 Tax=Candidatus Competibacter phosphatis TaxID=221280 RepID=A0ABX1TJ47_9GAMM|nr:response regulator [Candidatus Competibacter phosphatis]
MRKQFLLPCMKKIDLILLDIILPGLDGYQVCQHLKK